MLSRENHGHIRSLTQLVNVGEDICVVYHPLSPIATKGQFRRGFAFVSHGIVRIFKNINSNTSYYEN